MTLSDRFFAKVHPEPMSGCWLWVASLQANGYGQIWYRGKLRRAHRVSLLLAGRPVPSGMQVDHLCRTRCCVNPEHLDVVTAAENARRSMSPWGLNARKTHCPNGHAYSIDNTYTYKGSRQCRACRRNRRR